MRKKTFVSKKAPTLTHLTWSWVADTCCKCLMSCLSYTLKSWKGERLSNDTSSLRVIVIATKSHITLMTLGAKSHCGHDATPSNNVDRQNSKLTRSQNVKNEVPFHHKFRIVHRSFKLPSKLFQTWPICPFSYIYTAQLGVNDWRAGNW